MNAYERRLARSLAARRELLVLFIETCMPCPEWRHMATHPEIVAALDTYLADLIRDNRTAPEHDPRPEQHAHLDGLMAALDAIVHARLPYGITLFRNAERTDGRLVVFGAN